MAHESSKGYSFDLWHNMKWLTMQASPFVRILFDKLLDSLLVRKYISFHGTRVWLPCYRVIKNPQTSPFLRPTDLFSNIHYSIIRFNEILTYFLRFFRAFFRMLFLTPSYLSCTRQYLRLLSCQVSGILWTGRTLYLYGNYAEIRKQILGKWKHLPKLPDRLRCPKNSPSCWRV